MRIAIVLGTRPEIIKMSPIIRECQKERLDYFVVHSGQHYTYEMDRLFFEELGLPDPKYNLNVGSGSHAEQTARVLVGVETILIKEIPDVVLVEGDTNTVLGAALSAVKLHVDVGHVEAGARSYDRTMPEEINRILVDHVSEYLFAVTDNGKKIALGEGIPGEKIFVTGSTIVEAINYGLESVGRTVPCVAGLSPGEEYLLATVHREENVEAPERLIGIFRGLEMVRDELKLPVVFPAHPRTRKSLEKLGLGFPRGVLPIDPVGYLEFLQLARNAKLILTDSGGVQMEACIMGVPCVTLRKSTEWVETLEVGANLTAGCEASDIVRSAKEMLVRSRVWANPFGDGTAAARTIAIIRESLQRRAG